MIRLISIDSDGPFPAIAGKESNSMAITPIKLLMVVFSFVNISFSIFCPFLCSLGKVDYFTSSQ
jgi:hypothetical protein